MREGSRDYGKSVRARLLTLAKTNNIYYQTVLTRYFQERLLYRLSQTPYRNNFLLKGGALMYAYEHLAARPTLDIDFLGVDISNDGENIARTFSLICSVPCEEDGVIFDAKHISFTHILEFREYRGIRLTLPVRMDTISQMFTMDIGFGDKITPAPIHIDYPQLLNDMPGVNVMAYNIETVIAEKAHTLIDLAGENSRMKDYYDLYTILSSKKYNPELLSQAIKSTFRNRNTKYDKGTMFFRPGFTDDKRMQIRWQAFKKRIALAEELTFKDMTLFLQESLLPYWGAFGKQ